jgi:hypothetical protein
MGASFAIATGGVLTIAATPNASSAWVRVVDEVNGAVFEQEVTADLLAANQFLAPRLFMNNGATAAAVAFELLGPLHRPRLLIRPVGGHRPGRRTSAGLFPQEYDRQSTAP